MYRALTHGLLFEVHQGPAEVSGEQRWVIAIKKIQLPITKTKKCRYKYM
jgi:hypothetical protein